MKILLFVCGIINLILILYITKTKFVGVKVLQFDKENGYMKTRCPVCHDAVGAYKLDCLDVEETGKLHYQFSSQNYCANCGAKLNWRKIDLTNEWFEK